MYKKKKELFNVFPIGYVRKTEDEIFLDIEEKFIPALKQLENFSHVHVFFWFHKNDYEECRQILQVRPPYENAPESGVFACCSPVRPNLIGRTISKILDIDHENGIIKIQDTDADNDTPIIDLKPYFPVCDRVKDFKVPKWVSNWPEWYKD